MKRLLEPILVIVLLAGAWNRSVSSAEPVSFRFQLDPDDVYIVEKYQDIRTLDAGKLDHREEKNKIALTVESVEEGRAKVKGWFHTYSRPANTGEYRTDRDFFSIFQISTDGRYAVPDQYVMPNLRDLPSFPEKPVAEEEKWILPALETMDFGTLKIKIPLRVEYTYKGVQPLPANAFPKEPHAPADRIDYVYSFTKPAGPGPLRVIAGQSVCELWFDRKEGIPIFDRNRLLYKFLMVDGRIITAEYRIDTWYKKVKTVKADQKKEMTDQIKKDLEGEKNIVVREEKHGIALDLDAILFEHDSAQLTPAAADKLKVIAGILEKHPGREIRISGHTDSTGTASYNQKLSDDRARSVQKELGRAGIDGKRMSYKGYGAEKPAAPNTTPEGRQKNRRVEILIVTE